jgi:hypothetical protein
MKKRIDYRKIWKDAFGPIPKDEQGRSFEIHHIDGDIDNNSLSNLKCISIEEHLKLHEIQEDTTASHAIRLRLNKVTTGWHHSEETKLKQSAAKKGKKRGPYSEERCRAISEGKRGVKRNPESIRKMVETRKKDGSYKRTEDIILKYLDTMKRNGSYENRHKNS